MKKYLSLLLFPIVLGSCFSSESESNTIWDMGLNEFKSSITIQHYDFLQDFDFEKLERKNRLNEIFRIHEGGAFYLSFIFEKLNMEEDQLRFLRTEIAEGRWKKAAAEKIYQILSEKGEWDLLAAVLAASMEQFENDEEIRALLVESLYKSHQHSRVLEYSRPDFVSYYSVLSMILLKEERWKENLESFVFNSASVEMISELYSFLMEEKLFFILDDTLRLYMLAQSAYYHGNFKESGEYLKELEFSPDQLIRYPSIFYSLRMPFQTAGQTDLWSTVFPDESTFGSVFNDARLNISDKKYPEADRLLRLAIMLAETDYERDRASWYLMDLYKNNLYTLSALIEEFAPLWSDPYYFSDILEEFLPLVTFRGNWETFEQIYPLVVQYGDREMTAAYSWVRLLAFSSGFLSDVNREQMLERMKKSYHLSFYSIMATLLSEESIEYSDHYESNQHQSEADEFIMGFFDFLLAEQALAYSSGIEKQLNNKSIRALSEYASLVDNNLRSIQLINNISLEDNQKYLLSDIKLKYPNKYNSFIEHYAEEYNFPGEIFSGIIRTESAYTRDIVSYAGAVGLSQLMPETAAEQAGKLKIIDPDLTDPEINIRIGSSYIRWILDRPWSENMSQMLIAYNAGGGNLRKWKRIYPDYRDELFAEILPYKETRNYVKKVLASSVIYGNIYNGLNPEDTVRTIYPDFNSLKSINN